MAETVQVNMGMTTEGPLWLSMVDVEPSDPNGVMELLREGWEVRIVQDNFECECLVPCPSFPVHAAQVLATSGSGSLSSG